MAPASQGSRSSQNRLSTPQPTTIYPSARSGFAAPPPPAAGDSAAQARTRARTQQRRRQAVSNSLRRFESALPAPLTRGLPHFTSSLILRATDALSGGRRRSVQRSPATQRAGASARARSGTLAQMGFSGLRWSKLLSLTLLAAAVAGLAWFQTDDRWYVDPAQVQVRGTALVNPGSLVEAADVGSWNVFWLRRDSVRERLVDHPWVDDARVELSAGLLGGSASVRLTVQEAPAIGVWATEAGEFLISPHGAALPAVPPVPAMLPRLVDPTFEAALPGAPIGSAIETGIVASALALIEQVAGVTEVRYSDDVGLNFSLPGAPLWVYWGDGSQPAEKLAAIELGRRLVAMGDASKPILDVRNPGKPTLR
jgi:hypothetical protein